MTKPEISRRLLELSESPLQKVFLAILVLTLVVLPGALSLSAGLPERIVLPAVLLAIPILLSTALWLKSVIDTKIKGSSIHASVPVDARSSLRPNVIAVIPALNEEQSVRVQVPVLRRFVNEVIVVDDHSSDGTANAARMAGATVIQMPEHAGQFGATNLGIEVALSREATDLLICGADSWAREDDLKVFFGEVRQHEVVLGCWTRTYYRGRRALNIRRLLLFKKKIIAALLGMSWSEYTADAAILPADLVRQVLPLREGLSPISQCIVHARRFGVQPRVLHFGSGKPSKIAIRQEDRWRDVIEVGFDFPLRQSKEVKAA